MNSLNDKASRIRADHERRYRERRWPSAPFVSCCDEPLPEEALELPREQTVPSTREYREAVEGQFRKDE